MNIVPLIPRAAAQGERFLLGLLLAACVGSGLSGLPVRSQLAKVTMARVPASGIQPQLARDGRGILHMVYFAGDARHGNLFYVRSTDAGATFSAALRVNSRDGSAIAIGTIRGAQIAIGRAGRVHVAWNGSEADAPRAAAAPVMGRGVPMLYARLNEPGTAFEPQRNLAQQTSSLDGGGTVAADAAGNVYVAWHARGPTDPADESGRRVWVARSRDDGRTFSTEKPAWNEPTGACGCCGMHAFADRSGTVYALYRAARDMVNRDIYLLASRDAGDTFKGARLDGWRANACPMTSMDLAQGPSAVLGAWETEGQVHFAALDASRLGASTLVAPPGHTDGRKHPRLAVSAKGDTLLVWTEGAGWGRGGSLGWRLFDADRRPLHEAGLEPGVPVWSFAAAVAQPDGGFRIFY